MHKNKYRVLISLNFSKKIVKTEISHMYLVISTLQKYEVNAWWNCLFGKKLKPKYLSSKQCFLIFISGHVFLHWHLKIQSCLYEMYQRHWIFDEIMIFLFLKRLHAELKSKNGHFHSRIFKFRVGWVHKKNLPKRISTFIVWR